jgi:hypothetical protein
LICNPFGATVHRFPESIRVKYFKALKSFLDQFFPRLMLISEANADSSALSAILLDLHINFKTQNYKKLSFAVLGIF